MDTIITPAQLWIGNAGQLECRVIERLQQKFCQNNSCLQCSTCKQIQAKQYHRICWICPEKQYTLELLEPVFEITSFSNDQYDPFFFVLEHAELLTTACANRLLKVVEEPSTGYNFIFLTNRLHDIIPTIRSRCIIINHEMTGQDAQHPLLNFFNGHAHDPLTFLQILDTQTPNEYESVELIDQLLNYWYHKVVEDPSQAYQWQISYLQEALKRPPMTGGSKLFWRNLFMQWHENQNNV